MLYGFLTDLEKLFKILNKTKGESLMIQIKIIDINKTNLTFIIALFLTLKRIHNLRIEFSIK